MIIENLRLVNHRVKTRSKSHPTSRLQHASTEANQSFSVQAVVQQSVDYKHKIALSSIDDSCTHSSLTDLIEILDCPWPTSNVTMLCTQSAHSQI